MGKASWDARVTGLGPRDVPENDKRRRVGQSVVDAAAWREQQGPRLRDHGDSRRAQVNSFVIAKKEVSDSNRAKETHLFFK